MPEDNWDLISGGTLHTGTNTITKASTEYQVEAVEEGDERLALVREG